MTMLRVGTLMREVFLVVLLLCWVTACATPPETELRNTASCEVAIVGGGIGGVHTAFRLAPRLGSGVCLIEKNDRFGGRVYDRAPDGASPAVGVGARRFTQEQPVIANLVKELGRPCLESER